VKPETRWDKLPRTVYVWTGLLVLFVGFAVLFAPWLLLLHALGLDPARKLAARVTAAGFRGFLVWTTWVGVARVRGFEGLEGPFVVAANHESNLDICLVMAYSPRPTRLVAKAALRRVPVVGAAVLGSGSIFTEDDPHLTTAGVGDDTPVLDEGIRAIERGCSVAFFPEGTRSRGRGVRRFRKGAFELAAATGAPILPVVIVGSGEFMPAGGVLPLGPFCITVEALSPRRVTGDPDAFRRALRHEIAAAHARILAEPFHAPTRRERSTVPTLPAAVAS
jgi:1-acyl-sn-glycerol-3-phosphate acyltransferase